MQLDLNGAWSGTFKHHQYFEQIQARVRHEAEVTITFEWWWFEGTLDEFGRLDGELHHGDLQDRNTFATRISGSASSTRITLESASGFYSLRLTR